MREEGVQESLLEPYKRTRRTDPETSLAAAESVTELTKKQNAVFNVLKHVGPVTDDELKQFYNDPAELDPSLWLLMLPQETELPQQSESGAQGSPALPSWQTPALEQIGALASQSKTELQGSPSNAGGCGGYWPSSQDSPTARST